MSDVRECGSSKERSKEEEDQVVRSTKKVKTGEEGIVSENVEMEDDDYQETSSMEEEEEQPVQKSQPKSYKDMVVAQEIVANLKPDEIARAVIEDYIMEEERVDLDTDESIPFNPKPEVPVSIDEFNEWCKPWKLTLIVKLLGKSLSLRVMDRWIQRSWARKGAIRVLDMNEDFYIVRFADEGDYIHALYEGPWLLADHYLLVQRWRPLFQPEWKAVQKMAVWVRIPDLPMELYNQKFLWRVGERIGTMLKVDELTSIHSRGKFARICVEMDLRKKLIPSFTALGRDFRVEYEGLHLICFGCGRYGHRMEHCMERSSPEASGNEGAGRSTEVDGPQNVSPKEDLNVAQNPDQNLIDNQISAPSVTNDGGAGVTVDHMENSTCFGPWMLARKPQRKRFDSRRTGYFKEGPTISDNNDTRKSRFDILMSHDVTEMEDVELEEGQANKDGAASGPSKDQQGQSVGQAHKERKKLLMKHPKIGVQVQETNHKAQQIIKGTWAEVKTLRESHVNPQVARSDVKNKGKAVTTDDHKEYWQNFSNLNRNNWDNFKAGKDHIFLRGNSSFVPTKEGMVSFQRRKDDQVQYGDSNDPPDPGASASIYQKSAVVNKLAENTILVRDDIMEEAQRGDVNTQPNDVCL